MTVAYYASSQMLVFTAEEFGMPRIVRALSLWGEGKRTAEVIHEAFGVTADEYDARYRAWQKARLTRYDGQFILDSRPLPLATAKERTEAAPKDATLRAKYGLSLLHAHKGDLAKTAFEEALALNPKEPTALFLSARLALAKKDLPTATTRLNTLRDGHIDGYAIELARADLAEEQKDKPAFVKALDAAAAFDPSQAEPLKKLYNIAEEEKRTVDATELLGRLALLDQHDRKVWGKLLEHLVDQKRWDEAARAGESAVFVDVENAAVHIGYGRALAALGQHAKSAFELESATLCQAPPKVRATAFALLARERQATGDDAGARVARETALHLDPGNPEAKQAP
jgi:predicted Zn-dependent protease